jgi:hypothetical protein
VLKDEIKEQLNKNRKKLLIKNPNKVNVLATVRVAKKGSEVCYENVAILEKNNVFYLKEYTDNLPNNTIGGVVITEKEKDIICNVIDDYKTHTHYHTNSYSWLIVGCYYKGLDLIASGILEL